MKTLAQAIDEADNRWQHGIGDSGAKWEDFIAAAVITWFRNQEDTPTDIVKDAPDETHIILRPKNDYANGHTYDRT